MTYVRHMDPSLNHNLRTQTAKDVGKLILEFCRAAAHPHTMQRLEDAFLYHIRSYASSALLDCPREAEKYREEVANIIQRARVITQQYR